jgi:uncharacterized spore protein YtfJ
MHLIIYLLHIKKERKYYLTTTENGGSSTNVEVQPKPLIIIENEKAQLLRTIKMHCFIQARLKDEHFDQVYDNMQVVFAQEKGDPDSPWFLRVADSEKISLSKWEFSNLE